VAGGRFVETRVNGGWRSTGIHPALQVCARDARNGHLEYFRQRVRGVSTAGSRRGLIGDLRRMSFDSRGGVSSPPAVLHARVVRMRVPLGVHDPPLRAATAHNAPQEHRPAIARYAVVVPGHVTIDPAPHKSPSSTPLAAEWQVQCHVHGRLTYMKTCAESRVR
jgi:hypothetical protein